VAAATSAAAPSSFQFTRHRILTLRTRPSAATVVTRDDPP
jgi:hypothetical protein